MRAGSAHRDRRTVSSAGAALLVILAALVHLMTCAHGPESPAAAQSEAFVTVAAAPTDPGHEPERHCCADDEPAFQAPRTTAPTAHPSVEASADVDLADLPASPFRPGAGLPPPDLSISRSLACLGVWRT